MIFVLSFFSWYFGLGLVLVLLILRLFLEIELLSKTYEIYEFYGRFQIKYHSLNYCLSIHQIGNKIFNYIEVHSKGIKISFF